MIAVFALLLAASFPPGIEQVHRLDLLPRFRQSVQVASVSSYDRTGGNDDGFSGKYSFVRKEPGGLVLADLKGPGVIYRISTPTPADDLVEFYFDGEAEPRIRTRFRDLFTGERPPFVAPLVGFGGGGFYSYVPLPYRQSCKVLLRAEKFQFYQINYATYPDGFPIETFHAAAYAQHLSRAGGLFGAMGKDISAYLVPPGTKVQRSQTTRMVAPGQTVTLFETQQAGRITGLRLGPASALAGKERALLLKIYWDGEAQPAVLSPVGDFFGYAWGQPAMRSLLVGTEGDDNYVYFPMPFDKSARVDLVSESGTPVRVRAEVLFAPVPRSQEEGKFYAIWRRENPTAAGVPFTFVDTRGRGHVVGVILQAQGMESGNTYFFEGDDQTTIDGDLTIHGTGSEDFFNGGWYDVPGRWDRRLSLPLSGCLGYDKPLGRTGGYRLMLTDAYAFRKSIRLTIEHAPTGNQLPTDYAGVTFLYSESRPTFDFTLPPVAARKVTDPRRIVFAPGWNVPLEAFSLQNAVLAKKVEELHGEKVRFLSLRAEGQDVFGSHFLSLDCHLPFPGAYKVLIQAVQGPSAARVQLIRDEQAVGPVVDLYAPNRKKSGPVLMGVLDLREGSNSVFFRLAGRAPQSAGLDFDLVQVIFEKQEP